MQWRESVCKFIRKKRSLMMEKDGIQKLDNFPMKWLAVISYLQL